jgi:uracil-DNA glycosylase
MRWDERQRAMLGEIGIKLWWPDDEPAAVSPCDADQASAETTAERAAPAFRAASTNTPATALANAPANELAPAPVAAHAVSAPAPAHADATIASLDWPALRERVAGCAACKLCEGRRQTVFGVGNPRAHWMIVGEAPGEQEDQQGEPFVGKSGRLLDNMLRAVALTRDADEPAKQVYIANMIKCRPPGNRNPEPSELERCEPYLARQLQLVQPRIIVAMGRFAVQSLLRSSEPLGRLRGKVHRYQGVPLIATYHPAYLLRNPEEKARAWDDLCLAVETVRAKA